MAWIVGAAWGFAAIVGLIVLGFAAYELHWKRNRLVRDLAVLNRDFEQLTEIGDQLTRAGQRMAAARAGGADPSSAAAAAVRRGEG